jgi:hypothetical protein
MSLISARSISLDSTFNVLRIKLSPKFQVTFKVRSGNCLLCHMGPLNAGEIFPDFSWNSCLAAERGSAAPAHPHLKRFKTFYRMIKGTVSRDTFGF